MYYITVQLPASHIAQERILMNMGINNQGTHQARVQEKKELMNERKPK